MRYGLWKSVENVWGIGVAGAAPTGPRQPSVYRAGEWDDTQPPQLACSSCAGDYEDPDRTAWTLDEEEDEEHLRDATRDRSQAGPEEEDEGNDEFPAVEL